jgi:hypothetical protein
MDWTRLILVSDESYVSVCTAIRDEPVMETSERRDHNATNVLETFPAQYRPVLHGKKRDSGLCATFRTKSLGLTTIARSLGRSLCFALLAVFWVVNELLLSKKQLFTG